MWKWIILGGLFLFVVFLIVSIVAIYRGMFTVKHYREVALALEKIRQGAIEHPWLEGVEPELDDFIQPGDPRVALTSSSLRISYSITQGESSCRHHVAVSTPKAGHTTHAAGRAFVSFFVWRLGLDPGECVSYAGPASYHLEFSIDNAWEATFMKRPLTLPDEMNLDTIREEIQLVRDCVDFFDATEVIAQAQSERLNPAP